MQKSVGDLFTNVGGTVTQWFTLLLIFNFNSSALSAQPLAKISQPNNDTIASVKETPTHYLKPAALIVPGTFLVYTGLKPFIGGIGRLDDTIYSHIKTKYPGFHTSAEDYMMWAPSASIYFLDACKVKTKHTFKEQLILDAGSIIITGGVGYAMRVVSRHIDAYKTYATKFPSGHTANAFRGAELLHQEIKDDNKLISYSGYVVASAVGVLRIYNKDHLLTEVLSGAGLGILSAKLTYWIFDKVKYKK